MNKQNVLELAAQNMRSVLGRWDELSGCGDYGVSAFSGEPWGGKRESSAETLARSMLAATPLIVNGIEVDGVNLSKFYAFGAPGVSLSESAVEQRRSAQLQDMLTMLPCLKTLTGSQIAIAHELRSEGWMLSFFLEELPQLALQLTSGLFRGSALQDHFANDVSILRTQQQSVSARLRRANSSSLPAIEDLEVSTFRKLIRRHRPHGTIPLATGPEPINYALVNTPRVHPTGIPVRIECRVDTLRRSSAEVKLLSSTTMDGGDLLELRSKSSIVLTRSAPHRSMESGQRLLRSLESKEALKLIATLVLNWADGSPDHLELVDFFDKNDSHSPNSRTQPCHGASEIPKL